MSVLLVVPCFRESARIPAFLPELCATVAAADVEVLVVDDGSDDGAELEAYVESLRGTHACLRAVLRLSENVGKGGAVYAGWEAAAGVEWLGFVDADGSCSAAETLRVIDLAKRSSADAIFASRVKMLGRKVERQLKRHLIGRVYATLVSELLGIEVYDSQCGLKLVRRAVYEQIRARLFIQRFAFDVDLMTNLMDAGKALVEVPIDWFEVPGGKVRLLSDSWRMFLDVMAIRARRVKG